MNSQTVAQLSEGALIGEAGLAKELFTGVLLRLRIFVESCCQHVVASGGVKQGPVCAS